MVTSTRSTRASASSCTFSWAPLDAAQGWAPGDWTDVDLAAVCPGPVDLVTGVWGETAAVLCMDPGRVIVLDLVTPSGTPAVLGQIDLGSADVGEDSRMVLSPTGFLYVPYTTVTNTVDVTTVDLWSLETVMSAQPFGTAYPNSLVFDAELLPGQPGLPDVRLGVLVSAPYDVVGDVGPGLLLTGAPDEIARQITPDSWFDYPSTYPESIIPNALAVSNDGLRAVTAFRGHSCAGNQDELSDPEFLELDTATLSAFEPFEGIGQGGLERPFDVDFHPLDDWTGFAATFFTYCDQWDVSHPNNKVAFLGDCTDYPADSNCINQGGTGYAVVQQFEMYHNLPTDVVLSETGTDGYVLTQNTDTVDPLARGKVSHFVYDPGAFNYSVTAAGDAVSDTKTVGSSPTDMTLTSLHLTPDLSIVHPRPGTGLIGTVPLLLAVTDSAGVDSVAVDLVNMENGVTHQDIYTIVGGEPGGELLPGWVEVPVLLDSWTAIFDPLEADVGDRVELCLRVLDTQGRTHSRCWPYVLADP